MKLNKLPYSTCPNCGSALDTEQKYCSSCGQENRHLIVPIKHLIGELLESTIHFDAKSLKTIKELVFKPGHLTNEFNTGRRKSYVAPLRLYVFVSFIFFIIFNLSWQAYKSDDGSQKNKFKLSFSFFNLNSTELVDLSEAQSESLMTARKIASTPLNLYAVKQLRRIMNGGAQEFYHMLVKNFSYSIFILMPIFALIVKIFYRKNKKYYVEYLVYSLHVHTFGFFALSIFLIVSKFLSSIVLPLALLAGLISYFYTSERNVFCQSHVKIFFKTVSIVSLYFVIIWAAIIIGTFTLVLIF